MPHRDRDIPDWIAFLDNECLQITSFEAAVARKKALKAGVDPEVGPCGAAFKAAERTLDAVESGKVRGLVACKRAADALRKFTEARECIRK